MHRIPSLSPTSVPTLLKKAASLPMKSALPRKAARRKNVWELVGNVGSSAAKDRGQGFREKMGDCGITVTNSQTANWSITEGKQVTEAWLKESQGCPGHLRPE